MRRSSAPRNYNVVELGSRERPARKQLVEQLFAQHGRALRVFLRGRSVRREEIEDVVQEVFTRLMGVRGLEEKMTAEMGSNRAYLLSMASGLISDRWRKQRVRTAYAFAQGEIDSERVDERTPERVVAAQLELEAMRAVILNMPLNWRVALLLQRLRDMSYEQIALHMGVSVRQVERYLYRATRRLRKARRSIETTGEHSC